MVMERLQCIGAEARLIEVEGGPPVVYGEIGSGKRTLLIYNHYDVQPPEPLELWESEPFAAEIRDGKLYARGVSDNKGNTLARIQAVESWLATQGDLPLRIKWVVEGEEEVGSVHLEQFAAENRGLLEGADGCLWESGGKNINEQPVLRLGCKGIMYVELRVHGANRDIHSSGAAVVPNPVWRLVWALATLKDPDDHITVDRLMDHVAQPNEAQIEMLRQISYDEERVKADLGIPAFIRDLTGVELLKKYLFEPTCTICGILAGYTGPGSKTVMPNEAMAKVDFRLVENLTPKLVVDLLRKHLDRRGFTDVEIITRGGEHPALSDPDSAIVQAAIAATQSVYGQDPVIWPRSPGTGPQYILATQMGIPFTSGGVSHARSYAHAPNENIRLADYVEGIKWIGALIENFAAQ